MAVARVRVAKQRETVLHAHALLQQPGRKLEPHVLEQHNARFRHDFSKVRVHDDAAAAAAAAALCARAFTIGREIFFGAGEYNETSERGRRLIRHELAHVVQQKDVVVLGDERISAAAAPIEAEQAARAAADAGALIPALLSVGSQALVQCDDAQQGQVSEAPSRSISAVISLLKQARELSLGTPPQDQRALGILEEVYRYLSRFTYGDTISKALKGHPGNVTFAQMIVGEAVGGVHSTASFIRLGGHPSSGTWDFNLRKVDVAREYLEVIAGNIGAGESQLVAGVDTATDWGLEAARFTLELTPVIGSLIMFGEAVAGTSITGKTLSRGERALLGFGALLAEAGPLLRAGRLTVAASRVSEVAKVPQVTALRMCFAARTLTEAERTMLAELAPKVRSAVALTAKETVLLNRLMGKLAEADRIITVRAGLGAATGEAAKAGRFTNLAARAAPSEIAIGQALARDLSADVVRVAEDVGGAAGAKNPDFLINNAVAELVELETTTAAGSPIGSALKKIVDKHLQGGIVVADLTKSVVTAAELLGSADRLWGNPRFLDVTKLIVMRGGQVIGVLERPAGVLQPLVSAGVKGTASAAAGGEEKPK